MQVPFQRALRLCLQAALAAIASAAHADDGTIVITGTITDTTCVIEDPAGPTHTKVVQLPKISKSALAKDGDEAGRTPFLIKLKDCPSSLNNGVKAYFEPGPTTDYVTGDLKAYSIAYNASSSPPTSMNNITSAREAAGVQIRLLNQNGTKIPMGADEAGQNAQGFHPVTDTNDNNKKKVTLRYLAAYVKKSGEISAGQLTTYVGFSLVYP
ncbi:fimbrial protein [Bordetella bronchiseptica MO211]|nr:fimbrial protein [Bordetella bronchiseptica MO211]